MVTYRSGINRVEEVTAFSEYTVEYFAFWAVDAKSVSRTHSPPHVD